MKTKHTPGPWEVKSLNNMAPDILYIGPIGFYFFQEVATIYPGGNPELSKENAILISAAPDLLNSAILENYIWCDDMEEAKAFAKKLGWEMDETIELFSGKYRLAAIKKAIK